MERYKHLATVGFVLSIVGVLTGCATSGNGTSLTTNNVASNKPLVSASGTSNSLSSPSNHTLSISIEGKSPAWLVGDLKLASEAHFPVSGQTYALNLNATPYDNAAKPFNVFSETKDLWIAGFTGDKTQEGYSFYFGLYDVKGLYNKVKTGTQLFKKGTFIYMLESGSKLGGVGQLVPAISIDLGNGAFMAFSSNQIITKSDHAGTDQYVVYPVQGIKIPSG